MALFTFGKKQQQGDLPPLQDAPSADPLASSPSYGAPPPDQGYGAPPPPPMDQGMPPPPQMGAPSQDFSQPPPMGVDAYQAAPPAPAPEPIAPPAPAYEAPAPMQEGFSNTDERIEEIAEAIIDEKWQELVKDVKKVIEWKDTVESQIDHVEQQVKDVRASMDNMQKAIFGKISDYDKSISDVGTEIKAMEKVFQKILPNLTESVNKLERMTKKK